MKKLLSSTLILCLILLLTACGQEAKVAEVGKPAPDFSLVDRNGRTWNLAELRGQVVFVNFWATWCPPCRKEMPSMQRLFSSMPQDKFKMLSILYNDKPEVADAYAAKLGLTFPILIDPDTKAGKAYGLTGVPETYIIDKKGVLLQKILGPAEWDAPQVRRVLMSYIAR